MSRRNSDAEEQDTPAPAAFRYPPKSGMVERSFNVKVNALICLKELLFESRE